MLVTRAAGCPGPHASGRLEVADRETSAACLQDHRAHLDCGAELRLAGPQPAFQQRLRVPGADLRNHAGYSRHAAYAESPCTSMKLFKHPLNDTLADSFRDWFPGFRP